MTMTPEAWQRVKAVFQSALELPPAERGAFLDSACGGDPALRVEVESLLTASDADDTLRSPAIRSLNSLETARIPHVSDEMESRLAASLGGRYKLEGLLGRGGMGVVYKATDSALERLVAIKVLAPQFASDQRLISRFEREARIAAKLDHSGIIPIYAVEKGEGMYFFVMKYVQGKGLDEIVGSGALAIDFCQRILWECATALGHAHQRGIVHRDIKPANIIIDEAGRAVVTDFGISKAMQASTQITATGEIIGTPFYMSPEQAKGLDMDGRGDQYSLAMAGYHMLTGEIPFGEFPLHTVIYKQIFEWPKPIHELRRDAPAFLVKALEKAMSKDAEARFATMEEFATAVLPDRPVTPVARMSWANVVHRGSQRRLWILATGSVVAALALAAVLWLSNRGNPSQSIDGPAAVQRTADSGTRVDTTPRGQVTTVASSTQTTGTDSGGTRPQSTEPPAGRRTRSSPAIDAAVAPIPPAFGFLTINSDPFGTVFVDGVELGDVPIVNHRLAPGRHIIEVRREGFKTAADTVEVVAGNPIRLSKRLIPK